MPEHNPTHPPARWEVDDAEFRGYVRARLESINGDMEDTKGRCLEHGNRIRTLEDAGLRLHSQGRVLARMWYGMLAVCSLIGIDRLVQVLRK